MLVVERVLTNRGDIGSLRRIDWFWHTVLHELKHVKNRDGLNANKPLDTDLVGDKATRLEDKSEVEKQADAFAAAFLSSAQGSATVHGAGPAAVLQGQAALALQHAPRRIGGAAQAPEAQLLAWNHRRRFTGRVACSNGWTAGVTQD